MEVLSDGNELTFPIDISFQERLTSSSKQNLTLVGNADMVLGYLPALTTSWAGASQLNQAYKIVLPKGAGELVTITKSGITQGLLTTTTRGVNGQFAASAGLQSLANTLSPAVAISTAFSVASVIVGQYFLCQINKSLTKISENIKKIEQQVDAAEESIVFSACMFLTEIQNDWSLILASYELRNSITYNILETINKLTASVYYFERRLNSKLVELESLLKKNKLAEQGLIEDISRVSQFIKLAYESRCCLKLILLYLTIGISSKNVEEIKKTLCRDDKLLFSSTVKQLDKQIEDVIELVKKAPNLKLQEKAFKIKPYIMEIYNITHDSYNDSIKNNIDTTITKLKELDEKGCTFFIDDNNLYIENTKIA